MICDFFSTNNFLCKGIAINIVMSAESTSAIGCAYKIPFKPHAIGKIKITGIKQIPWRQAPRMNPLFLYQEQGTMMNILYKIQQHKGNAIYS